MKTKTQIMQIMGLRDEEKMLVSKAFDKGEESEARDILTSTRFLSVNEQTMVRRAVSHANFTATMWGGCLEAERKIMMFIPTYQNENAAKRAAPLKVLRCESATQGLVHRDYLGAIMALQISRELIGDIFIRESGADIVACSEIAEFLSDNLMEVGKAKVNCEVVSIGDIIVTQSEPEVITGTIASLRADAIISLAYRMSRSLASEFIASGRVLVNGKQCTKNDMLCEEKDVFSIRGKGRVVFDVLGNKSRKGRYFVELKKY